MKWVFNKCDYILTDTQAHAKLVAKIYKILSQKIRVVPVGADEKTFYPRNTKAGKDRFEVFFFGSMLPLHGIDIILGAIEQVLKSQTAPDVHFTLAGGKGDSKMMAKITNFIKLNKLSNFITYIEWVPYRELPKYIANADLCLGGPFGDTGQAKRVITGKTFQFLAMAKPTIVGQNQAHQLFIDKQNCLMVKMGGQSELARTIEWASQNRSKLDKIGKAGRKLYVGHYSNTRVSQKLKRIIDEIR